MITNKDVYKLWAPYNKKWVDWVRPVPFVAMSGKIPTFAPSGFSLPYISQIDKDNNSTAIIVDLPGAQGIEMGIQLAQHGYRPIPIYNGTMEQKNARATTDNHSILSALVWGASILQKTNISDNAPPAFLTDTNRLQRYKIDCSVFDNSWDVYHQDLPSEDYLLKNGITKIIIISASLSKDLKRIFNEYPKKQISIFLTDGYDNLRCIRKGKING